MPRYHFNVHDSQDIAEEDGLILNGPEEARALAVTAAGEALRDLGDRFWKSSEWQMHVTDEQGATVCDLRFTGTSA